METIGFTLRDYFPLHEIEEWYELPQSKQSIVFLDLHLLASKVTCPTDFCFTT
jgi:hypothetical protein